MVEEHAYDDSMKALVELVDDLHSQMDMLMLSYRAQVKAAERKVQDWKDMSCLRLYVHRKKDGNHVQAKWVHVVWVGTKLNRKEKLTAVPKSKTEDTYSMVQLKKLAKDWEWPLVEDTEKQLGLLRRQIAFIVKAQASLRYGKILYDKYERIYVRREATE